MKVNIDGVIIFDKPPDISSNLALQKVKRLLKAQKAGHAGTLDPLATGMLPILLGEACKFAQFILTENKAYLVTAKFGVTTNTGDSTGEVIKTTPASIDKNKIENQLPLLTGAIQQVPTMYSALKFQGKPLYDYARLGIEVPRQARDIQIHEFKLSSVDQDVATFYVHCSKGTYIRTLIEDLGNLLGCGAHVTQLRRVQIGDFKENQMITWETLSAASSLENHLLPIDYFLNAFPAITFSPENITRFYQGKIVETNDRQNQIIRIYDEHSNFKGVAEQKENIIKSIRLMSNETSL